MDPIQADERIRALEATIKRLSKHVTKYKRDHVQMKQVNATQTKELEYCQAQLLKEREHIEVLALQHQQQQHAHQQLIQQHQQTLRSTSIRLKKESAIAKATTSAKAAATAATVAATTTTNQKIVATANKWLIRQVARLSADTSINVAIAKMNIAANMKAAEQHCKKLALHTKQCLKEQKQHQEQHVKRLQKLDYTHCVQQYSKNYIHEVLNATATESVKRKNIEEELRNTKKQVTQCKNEKINIIKEMNTNETMKRMDEKAWRMKYNALEREVVLLRYSHETATISTQTDKATEEKKEKKMNQKTTGVQTFLMGDKEWYRWRHARINADQSMMKNISIDKRNRTTQTSNNLNGARGGGGDGGGPPRSTNIGTNTKSTGAIGGGTGSSAGERSVLLTKTVGTQSIGMVVSSCSQGSQTYHDIGSGSGSGTTRKNRRNNGIIDNNDSNPRNLPVIGKNTSPSRIQDIRKGNKKVVTTTTTSAFTNGFVDVNDGVVNIAFARTNAMNDGGDANGGTDGGGDRNDNNIVSTRTHPLSAASTPTLFDGAATMNTPDTIRQHPSSAHHSSPSLSHPPSTLACLTLFNHASNGKRNSNRILPSVKHLSKNLIQDPASSQFVNNITNTINKSICPLNPMDMISQIKELSQLQKEGILSMQEFTAAKIIVLPLSHSMASSSSSSSSSFEMISQIKELSQLQQKEILSKQEFTAAKKIVLPSLMTSSTMQKNVKEVGRKVKEVATREVREAKKEKEKDVDGVWPGPDPSPSGDVASKRQQNNNISKEEKNNIRLRRRVSFSDFPYLVKHHESQQKEFSPFVLAPPGLQSSEQYQRQQRRQQQQQQQQQQYQLPQLQYQPLPQQSSAVESVVQKTSKYAYTYDANDHRGKHNTNLNRPGQHNDQAYMYYQQQQYDQQQYDQQQYGQRQYGQQQYYCPGDWMQEQQYMEGKVEEAEEYRALEPEKLLNGTNMDRRMLNEHLPVPRLQDQHVVKSYMHNRRNNQLGTEDTSTVKQRRRKTRW